MKKTLTIILWLVTGLGCSHLMAQQNLTYNHYYLNPFLYNPSFIAQSGYSELYLNYRRQWVGFEGAPQSATVNLQLPLNYKSGLAFTGYKDEAGLIKTTTGLVSFSYQVFLGTRIIDLHKIGFGISAGYTNSRISDPDGVDFQDPVLGNRTSSLDGQFGIHYQFNRFKLGFAIPRLFQTNVAAEAEFTHRGISQIKNTITSVSYDFQVSPRVSIEPILTYRTYPDLNAQYEALASVKLDNIGWIGAAYRQDYGVFAFLGLDIKQKLKVGYAYEFATAQTDRIGYGSHEVQLFVRLGKKQFTRPQLAGKSTTPQPATSVTRANDGRNYDSEESSDETSVYDEEESRDQNPVYDEEETSDYADINESETEPASEAEMNSRGQITTTQSVSPDTPVPAESPSDLVRAESADEERAPRENVPVKLSGEGLAPGHYVVVGVFVHLQNALNFTATLKRAGYPANVAFNPPKNQYVVHMRNAPTIDEARIQRDKYRQMSRYSFRDTWILSVE